MKPCGDYISHLCEIAIGDYRWTCLVCWCVGVNVIGFEAGQLRQAGIHHMSRLTITLDDELHRALKETAARQGRSIASIIEESLRLRGIRPQADTRALVARARQHAQLEADKAMELAVKETRATRKR